MSCAPTRPIVLLAAAAASALAPPAAVALCPTPHTLTLSTPVYQDGLGTSLSFSGALLMVGAPHRDTAGAGAGAVYTFTPGGGAWNQAAQILAADAAPGDRFGAAVAYADPYAAIGAPGHGDTGSVYFFQRSGSTWTQVGRVSATSQIGADVGNVLAMSGTTVAIGVPNKTAGPSGQFAAAGAVFLYERTANGSWGFLQTIQEDPDAEPVAGERLGQSVALSGDTLVVGVPQGQMPAWPDDHGYVHIYRRDGAAFVHERRLTAPTPAAHDRYGAAVSTDGQFIAVGAPYRAAADAQGGQLSGAGVVFIYRRSGDQWVLDAIVTAADARTYDAFGSSVALRNGRLVVGSVESGKVYIFRRVGGPPAAWVQDEMLTDPSGRASNDFAHAIAFNGDQLAVGDPADPSPFTPTGGLVHLYNRPNFAHSDVCAGAVPIAQGTFTGCTTSASPDGSATCSGVTGIQSPDVWFSWTSACTGTLSVDTAGSDFDTVLSVHTACPGDASNQLACSDNAPGLGSASRVVFNYEPGQTYYIRLAGAGGASGSYTLNVLDGDGNPPSNNDCSGAIVVTDGSYSISTCRAGGGFPSVPGCGPSGSITFNHDVWFRYVAPITGEATLSLCGSTYPAVAAVYNLGRCPSLIDAPLACSTGGCPGGQALLDFPVTQGQEYLIRIGSHNTPGGNAFMTISTGVPCPADWDESGSVNSADISAFLASWLSSLNNNDLTADFDQSGTVNSADISAFLAAWLAALTQGC